ncbi:hypothetical protein [Virgibacillus salinus]|uniref:ABC transporter periplasmic binding protein yphF n=1 Tax=Virgibacillus salinus TaxID=553311 RepID=A0A1H1BRC9_9BACI|nr:hypothetical protein [Virgibacillus salinus]SDQ54310.1 hypothetical protein SAMN05216231_1866 [Virgibacillus salinus]
MKNTYIGAMSAFLIIFFLTGCLYPNNELSKNQVPNQAQLEQIQSAVDTYHNETNGLVPIRTKSNDTPIFQKYLINFNKLKEKNNISEIPANAYQNGGIYQYVLITPEENPRVKLIDLQITEAIREVSVKLEIYRTEHIYPPYGKEIADGVFKVDYKKLNLQAYPYVKSPYSKENLPIVMDNQGKLYVDYRIDLMNALKEYKHNYETGEDIRYLLADNSPFVPAYSLPYTIREGEPVFNNTNK